MSVWVLKNKNETCTSRMGVWPIIINDSFRIQDLFCHYKPIYYQHPKAKQMLTRFHSDNQN